MNERDLFIAALQIEDAAGRSAYLDKACADDVELRQRVEALLAAFGQAGSFLQQPAAADATSDMPPLRPSLDTTPTEVSGAVIGPYKLLQQIGEGGMGVVWLAEQTQPVQRKVALKVIKPGMDSCQVIARFEAERQALAMMDHVNIARVFDGGTTENGRPYFVMELVHGVPITKYCDDNHLTPRERLELFVPVCQAIQHAHQKGIIHRDIKPSNVMITLYDGKPVPKVIDFGVAKATEQKLTEQTMFTQYGTMVGTLEYMSPEQAEMSALGVDTRSDIYSLGVLLYELLTGSTPLTHKRMKEAAYAEILRLIKEEEPPKPSTRLSDSGEALASISANRHTEPAKLTKLVRGELDWIVMKCLEKDRNRRYETANGFVADVQRYLADEPVHACPPTAGYRMRKFVRRNKGPVLAASLVVLALMGGIIGTTWGMLRATDAEGDAVSEAKQKELALKDKEAALTAAQRAERERTEQLWRSYCDQARASRLSAWAGRRFDGLTAVDRARALLPSLGSDEPRRLTLRNEAIACLVLPDLGIAREWEGYPAGTTAVAFDATLERYARSDDKGISVRRVADDAELKPLPGPGKPIAGLLFSPDGRFLAANHKREPVLTVWDWQRGEVVFSMPSVNSWYAFSPDGRSLVCNGKDGGAIQAYDLCSPTKESKTLVKDARPGGFFFHPDGRRLSVGRDGSFQVWDLETGKVAELPFPGRVGWFTWSKSGLLAACVAGSDIYLIDGLSYKRLAVLKGHENHVVDLAFNHEGNLLASSAWDRTVRLWDVPTRRELVRTNRVPATGLHFSPDGRRLASGTDGSRLCLWEVAGGRECRMLERPVASVSNDGRLVVSAGETSVHLHEWATGKIIGSLPVPLAHSQFLDDHTLLTLSANRLYVWPIERQVTEAEHLLRIGPPRPVWPAFSNFAFTDPRRGIVSRQKDSQLALLDVKEAKAPVLVKIDHPLWNWFSFSSDGKWFATSTWHGTGVKVWDARSGALVRDLPVSGGAYAGFSPDGRWLVTGTSSEYRFWEPGSWQPAHRIPTHFEGTLPGNVAFSFDGALMAIRHSSTMLHLIDPASGRQLAALESPDRSLIQGFWFTHDGSHLFAGGLRGSGYVWNLRLIREQLAARGLDWDLPAYPLVSRAGDAKTMKVEVDLGDLTPTFTQKLWQDLLTGHEARHQFIETKQEGSLTATHGKQLHAVGMKAGRTYVLDLESTAFDTFLILEDSGGARLAANDDISASNQNSRIIYTAETTATYRVNATPFQPGGIGAYLLRIRELVGEK